MFFELKMFKLLRAKPAFAETSFTKHSAARSIPNSGDY